MTVQEAIDSAEANFGLGSTRTEYETFLLTKFNTEFFPQIRNRAIRVDKKFMAQLEEVDLVAGTALYKPTYGIRKLYGVWVKDDASSDVWRPVDYDPTLDDESVQANDDFSVKIHSFVMEGAYIRLFDIPDEALTDGLRFHYVAEWQNLALTAEIPLLADFEYVVIDGLTYALARRLQNENLKEYKDTWLRALMTFGRELEDRVELDTRMDNASIL